jgi:CelD/BcsL family acetyltransferase involved in cellulose biosynthesis
MTALAAQDNVRGYLLFAKDAPAAFLLCPIRQGCVLYDWVGYDPAFSSQSPGTVLQYLALEELFAENRHRLFDFTEGEGEHKEFWSRGFAPCADIYYLRPTARNGALVAGHASLHVASRRAVDVLERLGIKARLKRLLRARS